MGWWMFYSDEVVPALSLSPSRNRTDPWTDRVPPSASPRPAEHRRSRAHQTPATYTVVSDDRRRAFARGALESRESSAKLFQFTVGRTADRPGDRTCDRTRDRPLDRRARVSDDGRSIVHRLRRRRRRRLGFRRRRANDEPRRRRDVVLVALRIADGSVSHRRRRGPRRVIVPARRERFEPRGTTRRDDPGSRVGSRGFAASRRRRTRRRFDPRATRRLDRSTAHASERRRALREGPRLGRRRRRVAAAADDRDGVRGARSDVNRSDGGRWTFRDGRDAFASALKRRHAIAHGPWRVRRGRPRVVSPSARLVRGRRRRLGARARRPPVRPVRGRKRRPSRPVPPRTNAVVAANVIDRSDLCGRLQRRESRAERLELRRRARSRVG